MRCGSTFWRQGYRGGGDIARVRVGCIVGGGLEGWEGGLFLLVLFVILATLEHLLYQECDCAFAFYGLGEWNFDLIY
jgi:hypothetical protein